MLGGEVGVDLVEECVSTILMTEKAISCWNKECTYYSLLVMFVPNNGRYSVGAIIFANARSAGRRNHTQGLVNLPVSARPGRVQCAVAKVRNRRKGKSICNIVYLGVRCRDGVSAQHGRKTFRQTRLNSFSSGYLAIIIGGRSSI